MAPRDLTIGREYASFIGPRDWKHMVTLTTGVPYSPEALRAEFESRFIRRLAARAQRRILWFWAMEPTHVHQLHLHGLLAGTGDLGIRRIETAWQAGFSRAKVVRNPERAAAYVAKQLDRMIQCGAAHSSDVSRVLPPLIGPARSGLMLSGPRIPVRHPPQQ
jgi:hypothetical protein